MKVTIGRWMGFLELAHDGGMDEVRVTIPVPVGAFQSVREAFAMLMHDFSMWPREDDVSVAVDPTASVEQLKQNDTKRTVRYVS